MDQQVIERIPGLVDILGLDEAPMGIFFTGNKPEAGFSPKPGEMPTREKEKNNAVDWPVVFGNFSCVVGNIWRARRKRTAAYFSAERFGCAGAAFWLGFTKPQAETIVHYVSSGVPGRMEGEHYCDSPDAFRHLLETVDPVPARDAYLVAKPLTDFSADEDPLLVSFFTRPEPLCGLHQLAFFVTNDPDVVASPWGPACGNLVTWPLKYLQQGRTRAVLGGWDPSARKFFKTDELTFTVPFALFETMLLRYDQSFLTTPTWAITRKKIDRSRRAWDRGTSAG
jgi:uncharacterized protein (DUF169 family)